MIKCSGSYYISILQVVVQPLLSAIRLNFIYNRSSQGRVVEDNRDCSLEGYSR